MLFAVPPLSRSLRSQLGEFDELRNGLGAQVGSAGPWIGRLRRQFSATTAQSSVGIEGFSVTDSDAVAIVGGDAVAAGETSRAALASYAHAMEHVTVMAGDPVFRWVDRVVLDLHFDACSFRRGDAPGLWRTGPVGVTRPDGGAGLAYQGPEAQAVPKLMSEVVRWLGRGDLDAHVAVRAAMAHLHIVSVHPFSDGNGRVARIVQSLVLARDGLLAPELGSIEEELGRGTDAYYAALQEAQGGSYQPDRSAAGWVEFCIAAHIKQARRRTEQIAHAAIRWRVLSDLVSHRGWPDRLVIALEQSLFEGAERAAYAAEAGVSHATATNDLRRLADSGQIVQHGQGPATRYVAGADLRASVDAALAGKPS